MNKLYFIKRSAQLILCSMIMASCSDWTDTESLTINTPTLEDLNPELYEAYTASLREYKEGEHKVVIAKFDNKESDPVGQGDHISALPDSIDYVILNNPDNLNHEVVKDMESIRIKGTKTLYTIDYAVIKKEYEDSKKEEGTAKYTENYDEGGETPAVDDFLDFCRQKTETAISLFDKYKYDGINILFIERTPLSYPDEERMIEGERQKLFFGIIEEWKKSHPDAILLFEGTPENIIPEKTILKESKFITIPAIEATNYEELLLPISMSITEGVPTDRFIIGITIPSITNTNDKKGYLNYIDGNSKMLAVKGAAIVTLRSNDEYKKSGICINSAGNDYYNVEGDYINIKESINIMNPAPLN